VQNSILFFSSWNLSYGVWVVIWLPLLIGLSWMRTLKSISWVTAAANICILGSIIVILAGCTLELSENGIAGTIDESTGSGDEGASEPPSIEYWVIPQTFAIMLGTAVYAYEGIGVVIPCETSMRQPERFSRVLFAVMGFSIVNYCIFGLIPYLTFGSDTSDVITENMHALSSQSSTWLVLSYMVQVALVLAIIGTYPMQLFVVIDILEEWMLVRFHHDRITPTLLEHKVFSQNALRTLLVCLSGLVAFLIPRFGILMSLIGSVGSTLLQFVFPVSFELKLNWETLSLWRIALLLMYVSFGGVFGTAIFLQTVKEIFS